MHNMDPQRDVDPYNLCRRTRPRRITMTDKQIEWVGIVIVLVAFALLIWWGNNIGIERLTQGTP